VGRGLKNSRGPQETKSEKTEPKRDTVADNSGRDKRGGGGETIDKTKGGNWIEVKKTPESQRKSLHDRRLRFATDGEKVEKGEGKGKRVKKEGPKPGPPG